MPRSHTQKARGAGKAWSNACPHIDVTPGPYRLDALRSASGGLEAWFIVGADDEVVAQVMPLFADVTTSQERRARADRNAHAISSLLNKWWRARSKSQPTQEPKEPQ